MARPTPNHTSRSPEYALLGFLYEGPAHGYDLHQQLTKELGQVWRASQSQTYNILKRLEKQGDITVTTIRQEKLPDRQRLKLTLSGRKRFEAWLNMPTGSSVRAIRLEFITRLYFIQKIAPEILLPILDAQAGEIIASLTRLEVNQAAVPVEQTFNRLSLRLRIQQLHSVLNWLVECRTAFDNKSTKE
jgi:DNA-binding PadR family transcriptional regulator